MCEERIKQKTAIIPKFIQGKLVWFKPYYEVMCMELIEVGGRDEVLCSFRQYLTREEAEASLNH